MKIFSLAMGVILAAFCALDIHFYLQEHRLISLIAAMVSGMVSLYMFILASREED